MMQFDLHLRYEDEDKVRPYVVNYPLDKVGEYAQHVANLACVAQVFINIHPSSSACEPHRFTL